MSRSDLRQFLMTLRLSPEQIRQRLEQIRSGLLAQSASIGNPNFEQLDEQDLAWLFEAYDTHFFNGLCRACLEDVPLSFRVSSRLTSAGGKTSRFRRRGSQRAERFEIAVSSTLLMQSFADLEREVTVAGVVCHDRLAALQRIMEHELLHLIEMLVWDVSNCSAERFQSLARQCFGHNGHRHALVTAREQAGVLGLRPGVRVTFSLDGRHQVGVLNRVTKRATVLVEDSRGVLYSDGKRYAKFYVPLDQLQPCE